MAALKGVITIISIVLHLSDGVMITDRWLAGENTITVSSLRQICHGGRLIEVSVADGLPSSGSCGVSAETAPFVPTYLRYLQNIVGDCYKELASDCVAVEWSRGNVPYICITEEETVQRREQAQIIVTATCTQPDYVDQRFQKTVLNNSTQFVAPSCSDGQTAEILHAGFTSTCAKPTDYADQHNDENFLATVRDCYSQSSPCTAQTFNRFSTGLQCIKDDGTILESPEHSLLVTWGCLPSDWDFRPATQSPKTTSNITDKISTNNRMTERSTGQPAYFVPLIVLAVILGVVIVIMILLAVCYCRTKDKQAEAIYSLESALPVPALPANSDLHGSARSSFKKKKSVKKEANNGGIPLEPLEPQSDDYLLPAAKPTKQESSSKIAVVYEYSGVKQNDDEDSPYEIPMMEDHNPNDGRKLPDTPKYKDEYAEIKK